MNESLNDVRRAYRFLYQYQRKILDSLKLLTSEYQILDVGTKFSGKPKLKPTFKFTDLAWDFLPLYQPLFKFDITKKNDDEKIISNTYPELAIYITSDTGYFINKSEDNNDRTNLNRFAPCEESESLIVLMICAKNETFDFNERKNRNNKMITENEISYFEKDRVIAKKYDLSVFKDENSINDLKIDFKVFAEGKDKRVKIF